MLETTITIKTMFKIIFWLLVAFALIQSLKLDSTDKDLFHRSDLKLHIDAQTGCHYLTTWTGQITPRLDKNGKQVCTGYKEGK